MLIANRLCVPAFAAVLAFHAASTGAASMQPGLWEMTMTLTVEGKLQTVPTARDCISQKDIDDGDKTLPRPEGKCTLSNVQRSPDNAKYDLACTKDSLTMNGRADILFAAESYDGKVDLLVKDRNGSALPLAMTINARRVGACSK